MPTNRMIEKQRRSKRPQVRDMRPSVTTNPFTLISWGEPGWPFGITFDPSYEGYGSLFIEDGYGGGYE